MKFAIVFVALFVLATAVPIDDSSQAQIIRLDSDVKPDGYTFNLETSDGKTHQEEGQLKNVGAEDETIVVRGSFSFVADDGQTYTVNYVADENGFQPEGAHLPNVGTH
ncbi:larval cuticle protein 65Ag1-like [Eurosta solidaginis]|uniref:larval cuticle protein 65Ag1-like n=1 Tax=Eurosta solidaginis TaxID=178769 RepID=UPI003530E0D5